MAGIRNSRRARETRLEIENSLLSLLTDKPIKQVTVKAICQGADINRGTFYIHYQDVQDCLDQIVERFTQQILNLATKFQFHQGITERSGFTELLEMLKNEQLTATYILNNQTILNNILKKIQTGVTPKIYDKLEWYTNVYYVSGVVGVIQAWVNGDEQQSVTEIVDVLLSVLHPHSQPTLTHSDPTEMTISLNNL